MKILLILGLLSFCFCSPLLAKQYDVTSYSKEREINGRKCLQFFSYHDGSEHYESTSCN